MQITDGHPVPYSLTVHEDTISISQDGAWAGDGRLRDGVIEDCLAILGPDGLDHASGEQQEYAERVYEAIEAAISRGESSLVLDGIRYGWEVTDPAEADVRRAAAKWLASHGKEWAEVVRVEGRYAFYRHRQRED